MRWDDTLEPGALMSSMDLYFRFEDLVPVRVDTGLFQLLIHAELQEPRLQNTKESTLTECFRRGHFLSNEWISMCGTWSSVFLVQLPVMKLADTNRSKDRRRNLDLRTAAP